MIHVVRIDGYQNTSDVGLEIRRSTWVFSFKQSFLHRTVDGRIALWYSTEWKLHWDHSLLSYHWHPPAAMECVKALDWFHPSRKQRLSHSEEILSIFDYVTHRSLRRQWDSQHPNRTRPACPRTKSSFGFSISHSCLVSIISHWVDTVLFEGTWFKLQQKVERARARGRRRKTLKNLISNR